jgi:hypothetical protein
MSADIPVVKIESGIVTDVNKELAPLYFLRSLDFTAWLESRAIDSHRTNSRLLKKALRLANKDDANTVLAVNAVTITDNYWFKEDSSTLTWEDVRFKENYFDMLALRGDFDSFNRPPSRTPELTNIGSFEKCWKLIDGKWWLYKTGNDFEYFSEIFIARLAEKLDFPIAKYELDEKYVRTLDFTNGNEFNFESAESLVGDNEFYEINFNTFFSVSKEIASDYLKMIYLDTICYNVDRHTKNYFFYKTKDSKKYQGVIAIDLELMAIYDYCGAKKDDFINFLAHSYQSALPHQLYDKVNYIQRVCDMRQLLQDGVLSEANIKAMAAALEYDFPADMKDICKKNKFRKKDINEIVVPIERLWEYNQKTIGKDLGL